jgi:hypothetical protein
VFSARCAACHGPDLAKPKGRFGYVLDLARVAGNPEMIVPGAPGESELLERDERRRVRSGWFRAALLIAAALVGATGHFGGTLVFGDDFFAAP